MLANPIGLALRNRRAGQHTLVWARPDLQAPENFTLTSPAFEHGQPMPEKHRGRLFGVNVSPALSWTRPPAGTVELVLIVQDPDVPIGKPATHALTLGIDPSRTGIPENGLTHPSPIPGIRHGKGALGRRGWVGPKPPRSHGPHAYVFQLFALDDAAGLSADFTLDQVVAAIAGHVIGRARLDGTYEVRLVPGPRAGPLGRARGLDATLVPSDGTHVASSPQRPAVAGRGVPRTGPYRHASPAATARPALP